MVEPVASSEYHLGVKIINRLIIISILVILIYAAYDVFYVNLFEVIYQSIITLLIYVGAFLFMNYYQNKSIAIRVVVILIMLSIIAGFTTLGGLNGVAILDICNMFIVVTIIFSGREQIIFFTAYSLLISTLVYVHLFMPSLYSNIRVYDTPWFDLLEIICRCATAINVGFAVKTEYDKENRNVTSANLNLKIANEEVLAQNEEITQQRELIMMINEMLEKMVDERTAKIEQLNEKILDYAFFNAHRVRGPLARIMGLVNITRFLSLDSKEDVERMKDYVNKIDLSAHELDDIVKGINTLLSEKESILLGE